MAFAAQLRQQIEAKFAHRATPVRLALAPRLVAPGFETGYDTLDALLHGGLPVSGTSEIIGSRSSGRTTMAMVVVAERTREGHVCAWIDVSRELSPEAALADGVDLERVLWIRCAGIPEPASPPPASARAALTLATPPAGVDQAFPQAFPDAKPNLRPYNPTRNRSIGTPGVANRPLSTNSSARTVQVATDRLPPRRGALVLQPAKSAQPLQPIASPTRTKPFVQPKKPWSRLEKAIKAVDLLVQAGGFGAIVLDLGSIAPHFARRIPLATWFRWRAALERTRCSLIVLSQTGCSGSSAELVLRVEAELPEPGTVLTGISYRLQVVRRRFAEQSPQALRKPPQSATAWDSSATWAASGGAL